MASSYEVEWVQDILDSLEKEFYSVSDKEILKSEDFCHGSIDSASLCTANGLFKFINFSSCFTGNKMLDFCFLFFNFGLDDLSFNSLVKRYCLFFDLDYEYTKNEFRECRNAALCVYLTNLTIETLIEQFIYKNARQDKLASIVSKYKNLQGHFKNLKCYETIHPSLEKIFKAPVDFI